MTIQDEQLKGTEFEFTQEVVRTGVIADQFDLLLRFTNGVDQPELFMDEMVKIVLEEYLRKFGKIVVKINWFSKDLLVIAPNIDSQNALEGTSEAPQSTEESNP